MKYVLKQPSFVLVFNNFCPLITLCLKKYVFVKEQTQLGKMGYLKTQIWVISALFKSVLCVYGAVRFAVAVLFICEYVCISTVAWFLLSCSRFTFLSFELFLQVWAFFIQVIETDSYFVVFL